MVSKIIYVSRFIHHGCIDLWASLNRRRDFVIKFDLLLPTEEYFHCAFVEEAHFKIAICIRNCHNVDKFLHDFLYVYNNILNKLLATRIYLLVNH